MANGTQKIEIELNDNIGIVDGFGTILKALKEINTKAESKDGAVEWDLSSGVPGFSVKMRDEGIHQTKFVVGKKGK